MTKADIISRTLKDEMRHVSPDREPSGDEREYEELVVAELNRRLPDGADIKTCEDFRHLGVECCDTCHHFCPHHEMKVIDLPDGGKAWVCHSVELAIYPERLEALKDSEKLLRHIFGEDAADPKRRLRRNHLAEIASRRVHPPCHGSASSGM